MGTPVGHGGEFDQPAENAFGADFHLIRCCRESLHPALHALLEFVSLLPPPSSVLCAKDIDILVSRRQTKTKQGEVGFSGVKPIFQKVDLQGATQCSLSCPICKSEGQ